jgi:hypothetical protein
MPFSVCRQARSTVLRVLDEPELHHPGRRVRRAWLLEIWEVHAARALAALAARLGSPKAIIGEAVREVAKADLRSELAASRARREEPLREQTRQAIRTTTKG